MAVLMRQASLSFAAGVLALSHSVFFCEAQAQSFGETARRINQFEHELGPPVEVSGRPAVHRDLYLEMQRLHVPALSIAVIHKGRIEWVKGYGVIREAGPAVTPDTLFQAASISKSVTASAALRLCETGKLSLDAPVKTELKSWSIPSNPFTAEHPVTLRELLSHTAGISVYGFAGYAAGEAVPTLNQVLNGVKPANSAPIVVETQPGSTFRYSGGGYTIVQRAMMDATGENFPAIMQAMVLSPLGMTESTYEPKLGPSKLANVALPVDQQGKPVPGGPHVYPEMGAASLWTNPQELARWIMAIQNALAGRPGGLLRTADARTMVTPVKQGYGLGVTVQTVDGVLSFSHTGSNEGYKAMFVGYGDQDGVVVMTNSENGFALIGEVIPTLARIYNWEAFKPEPRTFVAVALSDQKRFIGSFIAKDAYGFKIALEGDHLAFSIEGGSPVTLLTSSATSFFEVENTAQVFFDTEDRGRLLIGHQTFAFERVHDSSTATDHSSSR